jgi:hypothetical protein
MTVTRTYALLSRWNRIAGDQPMPENWSDLKLHEQMLLRDADPELALILSGQALPPHLEMQLAAGTLPDVAPQRDLAAELHAAVQSTTQGLNPFHPDSLNLSAQLRLEAIAPDAAAAQRAAAAPFVAQQALNAQVAERQSEAASVPSRRYASKVFVAFQGSSPPWQSR